MKHIECIAIGNELLLGIVEEKNISWLCKRLTQAGGVVEQGVIVGDVPDDIEAAVRGAILRQAALVITCGGLGPTEDDQTMAILAEALNRPLEEHPEALAMVAERYRALYEAGEVPHPDLTPERRKMARLPRGAIPLRNTVGTAPGMLINIGDRTWVCALPGPPRENRPMVEQELIPRLGEIVPLHAYRERHYEAAVRDESVLAPLLQIVQRQHRDVYVKSRAAAFEAQTTFRILLATRAPTAEEAEARLDAAEQSLRTILGEHGIALKAYSSHAPA